MSAGRRRLAAAFAAAALAAAGSGLLSSIGLPTVSAGAAATAPAFTRTQTVTRTLEAADGSTSVVASNTVTLSVSQTDNLEGRQEITVSWSGAHPTGGIVANENSVNAQYEEYPMVLLQCRGGTSTSNQVTPQTCWTQSWTERYQRSKAYPPYQLDEYSTHGSIVGLPAPRTVTKTPTPTKTLPTTANCEKYGKPSTPVQYWVPWDAAGGKVYYGGTGGDCGQPPQANSGITSALPSNETFGVTNSRGTGNTEFDVFTTTENTTLGCSSTVPCSLVAVPVMGISCDAAVLPASPTRAELADLATCESAGNYTPGQGANTQQYQNGAALTVTGSLWWSPSNWRNRVVVPLTFAPQPTACSITGSNRTINAYGSELMIQATNQWDPGFCVDPTDGFSLSQVPTPEPEARDLLASGSADAAFTSFAQPGGYGKPVVNAPIAVTGFTISYAISLPTGGEVTTLKLTPLLLAKLLTQSYLGTRDYGDPALAENPLNITDDPEFHALNPEIPENTTGLGPGIAESELISLSSNSDVIQALTTYINGTPAARAFLNGTPDTSMPGEDMVVNPAYEGIQLPLDQWPLLSTYVSTAFDNSATIAPCLATTPQPLYSLIDAPLSTLEDVSEAMQFEKPNSTMTCSSNAEETVNSMVGTGRQQAGHYFMLGITPLADDDRYNLRAASLETTSGTFVAPTDASLQAATALLQPDTATGTWTMPYDKFRMSTGSSAYPGTLVVYSAVPTSGLTATVARGLATFLEFAATTGQATGSGVGQLPSGYLPMTAADGLGTLASYTLAAAADVEAQHGEVPPLVAPPTSGSSPAASQPATAPSTPPGAASAETATGVAPAFAAGVPQFADFPGLPTILAAGLPIGTTRAVHAPHHPHAKVDGPAFVELSPTADESLWVGSLPVVLVLLLALLGIVVVPAFYRLGRRRGRW